MYEPTRGTNRAWTWPKKQEADLAAAVTARLGRDTNDEG
jgi:hypothetical protein